jgi:hypothetical protein
MPKESADFPIIVKTRHQFVAVPEDAKLSCTAISYSSTGVIYRIKLCCQYDDGIGSVT